MQAVTIEESKWDARKKYAEYLRAVKDRHSAEYEALKNAYRELSRGNAVLDLVATMRQAGVDNQYRPKLAVVRADARLCWFQWRVGGTLKPTFQANDDFWKSRVAAKSRIQLPATTFGNTPYDVRRSLNLRAVVPTIPPSLMPAANLDRYVILWEAEWESIPIDPMLLAPLGKHLYRVLATWDLTPLERAVLSDRL